MCCSQVKYIAGARLCISIQSQTVWRRAQQFENKHTDQGNWLCLASKKYYSSLTYVTANTQTPKRKTKLLDLK